MKAFTSLVAFSGFLAASVANPVPGTSLVVARGGRTNLADIWADVEVHIGNILDICADVDIDIDSPLDIRAKVAAQLQVDLDACAAILADATVALKATAKADILSSNSGCDAKCIEKAAVDHTKKFCGAVDTVVKKFGEDAVKRFVKPTMTSFGRFSRCMDGIFVGLGAQIGAAVDAILGVALSLDLGLDLDLDLGLNLGGIIRVGRV